MKSLVFPLFYILIQTVTAQNVFKAKVLDAKSKEPLIGVNAIVSGSSLGTRSDISGIIEIKGIPDGQREIKFSFVGYQTQVRLFVFPAINGGTIEVKLEQNETDLDEI